MLNAIFEGRLIIQFLYYKSKNYLFDLQYPYEGIFVIISTNIE